MGRILLETDVTTIVIGLIAEAENSLETDHAISRDRLTRACALLEVERYRNGPRPSSVERGGLAPWQRQRVQAHIDAHLGGRIEMSDLTSIARLSTSHFARAFKTSFGAAPFAYIARARIDRAKQLMLETDTALSQIALECGMCDQSHFTRVFSRIVGESPNNWRRSHSSGEPAKAIQRVFLAERRHAA